MGKLKLPKILPATVSKKKPSKKSVEVIDIASPEISRNRRASGRQSRGTTESPSTPKNVKNPATTGKTAKSKVVQQPRVPPKLGKRTVGASNNAPIASTSKRTLQHQTSDTNNNEDGDVLSKRRRTQLKPFQVPDPISTRTLNKLLASVPTEPPEKSAAPLKKKGATKAAAQTKPINKGPSKTPLPGSSNAASPKVKSAARKNEQLPSKGNKKPRLSVGVAVSKKKALLTSTNANKERKSSVKKPIKPLKAGLGPPPGPPVINLLPVPPTSPPSIPNLSTPANFAFVSPSARTNFAIPVSATSANFATPANTAPVNLTNVKPGLGLNHVAKSSKAISKSKKMKLQAGTTGIPNESEVVKIKPIRPKKKKVDPINRISIPLLPPVPPTITSTGMQQPLPTGIKFSPPKKKKLSTLIFRPNITLYPSDPTFESALPLPFISTLVQSKLLIRSVLAGNNTELESLMKHNNKQIASFCVQRSINNPYDAFYYAIQTKNIAALKILMNKNNEKLAEALAPFPDLILQTESTGKPSYLMFGHAMRNVAVSRGGKEGNDAFTKDKNQYSCYRTRHSSDHDFIQYVLEHGYSWSDINSIASIYGDEQNYIKSMVVGSLYGAVWRGHHKLAGDLVEEGLKRMGFGYNLLHKEALTLSRGAPFTQFKSISITKKSGTFRITPVHCAAINPDPIYLKTLLSMRPDCSNALDISGRTPIHFAAVCISPKPLEYLISLGISLQLADKEGKTPLYLAAEMGRVENVKVIARAQFALDNSVSGAGGSTTNITPDPKDSLINRPNQKNSFTPLHVAVQKGHFKVVDELLNWGANPEKSLSAQYEKLTPAMIAAQHGYLDILKLLIEKADVNIDAADKRGKSALTHAVIDGQGHVVSYLLRLGANNHIKDGSGNTLAHYAAAYGWYFIWNLLMESGCAPNDPNDWKMTPVGVAFLKGHMGLVEVILSQPGIDINSPIDDTTGQNLLLQTCSSKLSDSFIVRLKFLIEAQKANCSFTDIEKNNALHYLVATEAKELEKRQECFEWVKQEQLKVPKHKMFGKDKSASSPALSAESFSDRHRYEELIKNRNYIKEAIEVLLRGGCSSIAINSQEESPATLAFKLGCIELITLFIENGTQLQSLKGHTNKSGDTILHNLIHSICDKNIKTWRRIQIKEFMCSIVKVDQLLKIFQDMAKIKNKNGFTPLHHLLKYFNDGSITAPKAGSGSASPVNKQSNYYIDSLSFLMNELQSDVNAVIGDKSSDTPLHLAVSRESLTVESIQQLLLKKPNLDCTNAEHKTPLVTAIIKQNEAAAICLIQFGANVNISVRKEDKSILILAGEKISNNFNIIPALLARNVHLNSYDKKSGNSILHLLAMRPNVANVTQTMKQLIAAGCDVTKTNIRGQAPLHLVINERGGETDVSYDLEELLIESSSSSLLMADVKGRTPLHYVFVKQSNETGADFRCAKIDPIELVALITRSIKETTKSSQGIFSKDANKSTPLHYASLCGSIICISLLIKELKVTTATAGSIDEEDVNGNTAFGLAVWKGNDGTALQFQINDADFLRTLNTYETPQLRLKSGVCQWLHVKQIQDESTYQLKQESKYSILQEVIRQNKQGLLHLMLEKLANVPSSQSICKSGDICAVEASLKTQRLKLTLKLLHRVKDLSSETGKSLNDKDGTLFHILAKTEPSEISLAEEIAVVESLISKNVSIDSLDEFGSNALIYAAINWNVPLCIEFCRLLGRDKVGKMTPDCFGRTPFTALFWKLIKKSKQAFPEELKKWGITLVYADVSPEHLTSYPIILSNDPGIGYLMIDNEKSSKKDPSKSPKMPPLILGVLSRNYEIVKWLLNVDRLGYEKTVNVDCQDELGRTALMYAVKLNDIKMVKLILNPRSYDPSKDKRAWYNKNGPAVNLNSAACPNLILSDVNGWTVFHHLVSPIPRSSTETIPNRINFLNSIKILRILTASTGLAIIAALERKTLDSNQTVLELAKANCNSQLLIDHLEQILRITTSERTKVKPHYDFVRIAQRENIIHVNGIENTEVDMELDSQEIVKSLLEDKISINVDKDSETKYKLKPDPLAGIKKGAGVILEEVPTTPNTTPSLPFDCLLTQVDLQYGLFGLYNFYKMQIIKQTVGKELILLFTRWGRVGSTGQYQKTPFADAESAIKEFKKIFRAKTGNNWESVQDGFVALPKKYRLVNIERRKMKSKNFMNKVQVDFEKIQKSIARNPSKIPDEKLLRLIKKLCLVHKPKKIGKAGEASEDEDDDEESDSGMAATSTNSRLKYQPRNVHEDDEQDLTIDEDDGAKERDEEDRDDSQDESQSNASEQSEKDAEKDEESDDDQDYKEGSGLPLGLLDKSTLEKGDQLLDQISKLIQEKDKIGNEQDTAKNDGSTNRQNDQYSAIYDALVKLSEEFFTLIPIHGFSFERIEPIFTQDLLRKAQLQIHHLVHLEFATKLLLAAQTRATIMNPFDYIYNCLNTRIEFMNPATQESQLILQYIHNTAKDRRLPQIDAIYRIERPGEMERVNESGIDNRWLLWHGTKNKNLLSILHSGLQAVPLGVSLSGHAFGKGIYFADLFEKSSRYCYNEGQIKDSTKFILLCEVALGKVQEIDLNSGKQYETLDTGFNSFKTANSRYEPDPGNTIVWNDRTVPLGKKTNYVLEEKTKDNDEEPCYGMDFNEFVVFDKNQVCIRYMIQFRD